uniref:DNA oxidative demethylase ALKBH2-like n=1 Tax=Myxine glutinosa TaxID=7769 RepID=UPI00358EE341
MPTRRSRVDGLVRAMDRFLTGSTDQATARKELLAVRTKCSPHLSPKHDGKSSNLLPGLMTVWSTEGQKTPGSGRSRCAATESVLDWHFIRDVGLDCDYVRLYSKSVADDLLTACEEQIKYFSGDLARVRIFGKWHNIPRQQATYGDPGLLYRYSGLSLSPEPWIPVLTKIRDDLESHLGLAFNFVLVNRYRNGLDHVGEHRDDEKELVPRSPIASVSLGAPRDFVLRHGLSRHAGQRSHQSCCPPKPVRVVLEHGSLLVMKHPTNIHWYHSVPVRKRVLLPRVNLTFRMVLPSAAIPHVAHS